MARKFDINKLPKDVRVKIDCINWAHEGEFADENTLGECWLKDGWLFDGETHYTTFNSRSELIEDIRQNVEPEWK